jgi:hypothetical protein
MSLTGKTINQLTLTTNYNSNAYVPVYFSGQTFKSTFNSLEPTIKWKALLTQTGPLSFTGSSDPTLNGGLILNEIYTIDNFVPGDNFSDIAQLITGTMNTTGCVFKVTGATSEAYLYPSSWAGSLITSDGELIVNVLENTLGVSVTVQYPADNDPANEGIYRFLPSAGFFPPNKTIINVTSTQPYTVGAYVPFVMSSVDRNTLTGVMFSFNFFTGGLEGYILNNLPVEIIVYKN